MQARARPGGVKVLAVLAILIGLLGIAGGALLLTSSDVTIVALSAFAVLVGVLYLVTGVGFLQGIGWSWFLGLIVSILSLIRNVIEAVGGGIAFALPGIVVALVIIYYLTRPEVKGYFGRGTGTPLK